MGPAGERIMPVRSERAAPPDSPRVRQFLRTGDFAHDGSERNGADGDDLVIRGQYAGLRQEVPEHYTL